MIPSLFGREYAAAKDFFLAPAGLQGVFFWKRQGQLFFDR
jgi:hypothetical protein